MMKRMLCAALAAMAIGAAARGQTPDPTRTPAVEKRTPAVPMPKPGPELEKFTYFIGQWTSTGSMKPSALGEGGDTKGRESCGWLPGKFFLGCMMITESPMGRIQTETIMGWDAEKKTYTSTTFDSTGRNETATGTFEDGNWTWSGETKMGAKILKSRFVVTASSSEAYSFQWDTSPDGKNWSPLMQGKADKMAKPTPAMKRTPVTTPDPSVP